MKLNRLNWLVVPSILIVIGSIGSVAGQDKQDQREKKTEIRMTISNSGEGIHLRMEKKDGSVYEKTYANKEEMKNDPELKDLNLHIGDKEGFLMRTSEDQDGNFEWIEKDEDGNVNRQVMKFKSEDGSLHEFHEEGNVWIDEFDGSEGSSTFLFENEEGDSFRIIRDEDGEIQIEKNGELINIEEMEKEGTSKVDIRKDGTVVITNEEGDGSRIKIFKSEEGNDFTMEYSKDHEWKVDSTENVFYFGDDSDVHYEKSVDGNYIIRMDVESEIDEEGNQMVIVHKKVEKVRIEILDINNLKEISEVPGVLLNDGLGLEEVDYYPNPSQGQFTLKFKGKRKPIEVKILDMKGQEVYNESINDFGGIYDSQIDLSGKEAGLYVLQVIQNDKSWTKKIVIE